MSQLTYLYQYKATITSVYDGDTVTADIDLGFGVVLKKQKIRLLGIDTPELRGEERDAGIKVRDYVRDLVLNKEVTIKSHKDKSGKYGRWLAEIYFGEENVNLNQKLLLEGLADVY